jgi:MFS family permease
MTVVNKFPGRPTFFRVVADRSGYRRLWAARTVSQSGDIAQFTTVALLVFHLTHTGLGVSILAIAEIAPVVLLAPIAGTVADRWPRARVMVMADVTRFVLATLLAVFHNDAVAVYALAFGMSAGSAFFNPAAGSLLPSLVSDDELVAANSGIWSTAVLSQVLLAPAAGLIISVAGYTPAFAFNAGTFAASALFLSGLHSETRTSGSVRLDIFVGMFVKDRLLRALVVAQALAALSAGATSALLVVLARERLRTEGTGFGLMLGAIAIGAFSGPIIISRVGSRLRQQDQVFVAFGLRGMVDLALASVANLPASLVALVGYGLGTSSGNIAFNSLIQSHVVDERRGRVFATFDLVWQSMRLLSLMGGGLLADAMGVRAVYVVGGILLLGAGIAGSALAPRRGSNRL